MKSLKVSQVAIALAVAAVLVVATGCSSNQSLGVQVDDAAITTKVKAKLTADPEINPFKIDVDTNEGVVRLSGTVEKPEVRYEAARIARSTEGVERVINDIKLGEKTLGERLDDTAITTKVKAKLTANPDINPFNVGVDTQDGVVTLTGRVVSKDRKDLAERLARETDGVRGVKNMLKIGDMERSSD